MPDPKDNAKASGDFHPPEGEDMQGGKPGARPEAEGAQGGAAADSTLSRDEENEGRAGKGINQAGYLKDKDGGMGGRNGA